MKSMFKNLLVVISIFCCSFLGQAQDSEVLDTLLLDIEDNWRSELLEFPISFAPSLAYTGVEEVRFAKGWSDNTSDEFWTYAFVWKLEKNPTLSTRQLRLDLAAYFDGLMQRVSQGKSKDYPTKVSLSRIGNSTFYEGQATIYDAFFLKDRISLNVSIEEQYCEESDTYTVLFLFSPQDLDHDIWKTLRAIQLNFPCN